MSWEAYKWVTMYAPIPKPDSARIVLYGLAEHAHADGTAAYPSKNTLAGYIIGEEVSEGLKLAAHETIAQGDETDPAVLDAESYLKRVETARKTVKRAMNTLRSGGWISEGDQSRVSSIPFYRRPKVWDLNLTLTRATASDRGTAQTPGDNTDPRGQQCPPGDSTVQTRGQNCPDPGTILSGPGVCTVPQTSIEPSSKPLEEPPVHSAPSGLPPAAAGGGEGADGTGCKFCGGSGQIAHTDGTVILTCHHDGTFLDLRTGNRTNLDELSNAVATSFTSIWDAWPRRARKSDKRHKAMDKYDAAAKALGSEQAVLDRFNHERPDLADDVGMVATWLNQIIREAPTSPAVVVPLKDGMDKTTAPAPPNPHGDTPETVDAEFYDFPHPARLTEDPRSLFS